MNNSSVNSQQMRDLLNQAYMQRLGQMLDPVNIYAQKVGQGLNALRQQQSQQQVPQLTQEQLEAIRNDALYGGRIPYPVQQQQSPMPQGVQYLPRQLNEIPQTQYLPRSINNIPQVQLLGNNISQQPQNIQLAYAENITPVEKARIMNQRINDPNLQQNNSNINSMVNRRNYEGNPIDNETLLKLIEGQKNIQQQGYSGV